MIILNYSTIDSETEERRRARTSCRSQVNRDEQAKRKYGLSRHVDDKDKVLPLVDESYQGHHRWRPPEARSFPEDRNSKDRSRQEERKHADGEPGDAKTIHEEADNGIAFRDLHRLVGFSEEPFALQRVAQPADPFGALAVSSRGFKMKRLHLGEREREDERSAQRITKINYRANRAQFRFIIPII